MDAVTYPHKDVITFLNERMIAHKLKWNTQPLASKHAVKWTPTLIMISSDGREHHRSVGYVSPTQLIPTLLLGFAKYNIDQQNYNSAKADLSELLSRYPKSDKAPESIYFLGITQFKLSNDVEHLKSARKKLIQEFPDSSWIQKLDPYKDL